MLSDSIMANCLSGHKNTKWNLKFYINKTCQMHHFRVCNYL